MEQGLVAFLVNENGFNHDRVVKATEKIKAAKDKGSQGRMESFFKPVINTSEPLKRKDAAGKATKVPPTKKSKTGAKKK
ncbi:hypothetical protein M5K25_005897 [Dendrobium thyrsiflorum]|uniref:Uncharacterized protein n=1 Tax=Dendrobium thyrsiflorum TaxID=117978 RepID=A0ABD0VA68_DENTH